MKDIAIFGKGGLGREVAFLIKEINEKVLSFTNEGWIIAGFFDIDEAIPCDTAVIAIGTPEVRAQICKEGLTFPNLIHPSVIMPDIEMGTGNVIAAGNIICPNVIIGAYNYINMNCTIGHDTIIGDCCVINPGANISGGIEIGNSCLIGTGATILQYLKVGEMSTVGAGAVVTKDVPERKIVKGVPAK